LRRARVSKGRRRVNGLDEWDDGSAQTPVGPAWQPNSDEAMDTLLVVEKEVFNHRFTCMY